MKIYFQGQPLLIPELMVSVPKEVTAATGFDAFAHNFEALISTGTNPYVRALALSGIELIINNLPKALEEPLNLSCRGAMAWADTLGGLAISSGCYIAPRRRYADQRPLSSCFPRLILIRAISRIYKVYMEQQGSGICPGRAFV